MQFLLSNIGDATFTEVCGRYKFSSTFHAAELCRKYRLGMELTELSLVGNLDQNREHTLRCYYQNARSMEGLPLAVHAPFSELYCHAMEHRIVQLARDSFGIAYGLAEDIGASKMVIHANHVASIYHPDWVVDHQVAFWKDFLQQHPGKVAVALENTIDETPELLLRIAQGVDDPRLGICLDMGHANLSHIPVEEWIKVLAPYLIHYHIHNNDGIRQSELWFLSDVHNELGQGSLDLEDLLHQAEQITPNATVTVETSALEASIDWLIAHKFIEGI